MGQTLRPTPKSLLLLPSFQGLLLILQWCLVLAVGAKDVVGTTGETHGDMWEYRVKLVRRAEMGIIEKYSLTSLRLIIRSWHSCKSTLVIAVPRSTEHLTLENLKSIRRCGPGIRHNCFFYEAAHFESTFGGWSFQDVQYNEGSINEKSAGQPVVGYLVVDQVWDETSPDECADAKLGTFRSIAHPLRPWHPDGFSAWLRARSAEQGFADITGGTDAGGMSEHVDERVAAEVVLDVCSTDDFDNFWRGVWPRDRPPPRQILVIGCASLEAEPTQELLERGIGGLFMDMETKYIRRAKAGKQAIPGRLFINTTVLPSNIGRLLRTHADYVRNVDILQVDIDTIDGPLVIRLLQEISPKAIVVEFRNFVPFPLRYASLSVDSGGLPGGGATLAYWLYELNQRGYDLAKMHNGDAVFLRRPILAIQDPRRHYLSILACYLHSVMQEFDARFVLEGGSNVSWRARVQSWMEVPPLQAVSEVWKNLTTWRNDLRFFLDVDT